MRLIKTSTSASQMDSLLNNRIKNLLKMGKVKPDSILYAMKRSENSIGFKGIVEVTNGYTHFIAENRAVGQLLLSIVNWISSSSSNTGYSPCYQWNTSTTYCFMVIGSDTGTATYYNQTSLTSPIGTTPGTKPNSQSAATSNPSNGVYRVTLTATWNAGTVSGTCGEIGLYLYINNALQAAQAGYSGSTAYLSNRLSSAGGDFTAFTINTAAPLVIAWTLQFSF